MGNLLHHQNTILMKKAEILTRRIGQGAANLMETSHDPRNKLPSLTIMFPRYPGYGDIKTVPPRSFMLSAIETRDLYKMLREYYEEFSNDTKS